MSLVNKVAIVTGASSGIGAAIAVKLTAEGARVAIVGRNETKLKIVFAACEKQGVKPLTIIADVSKDDDAKKIITETLTFFGKIDILVNNAEIEMSSSILDEKTIDVFDKIMSTNLRACVYLTHLAAKHLIETKGNIINISSVAGLGFMSRNGFSYCISKAALDHFTRCIALELAPNVRVNGINPGPVKTGIIQNLGVINEMDDIYWEDIKKATATALDRIAESEEIAELVAFVASDKARSITGSSLISDNGIQTSATCVFDFNKIQLCL